jgi:hypothetical protein
MNEIDGAPGTIRTSDPQIRSLTPRTDKLALSCKPRRFSPLGDQGLSHPFANQYAVIERDDGMFEILPDGSGPFPTRAFAEAVAKQQGGAA